MAAVSKGNGDRQKVVFRELQQCMLEAREVGNTKLEISAQLLDIVSRVVGGGGLGLSFRIFFSLFKLHMHMQEIIPNVVIHLQKSSQMLGFPDFLQIIQVLYNTDCII